MKFIITEEQFNEMLDMMQEAPFGKVMKVIKTVTANPHIEPDQQMPELKAELGDESAKEEKSKDLKAK